MLTENENQPAQDRSLIPYRQLGVAVIHAALVDFGVVKPTKRSRSGMPSSLTPNYQNSIAAKLSRLRRQIRAGEFLVERSDALTVMWFLVAGLDLDTMRRKKTHWPFRLRAMREREELLLFELRKRQRKQMAMAREARYGDEGDSSVGRHAERASAVQRANLRPEDCVGAGLLLWPENVLRRTGGPAADVDGSTDGSADRTHGRDDGSLGNVS